MTMHIVRKQIEVEGDTVGDESFSSLVSYTVLSPEMEKLFETK